MVFFLLENTMCYCPLAEMARVLLSNVRSAAGTDGYSDYLDRLWPANLKHSMFRIVCPKPLALDQTLDWYRELLLGFAAPLVCFKCLAHLIRANVRSILGTSLLKTLSLLEKTIMSSHFLLYRNNGDIFDLPILTGAGLGDTSLVGTWDNNWSHIKTLGTPDKHFFLLYKRKTGQVYTMPILGGNEYGVATQKGIWETDWAHIVPFSAGTHQFVLLCRDNGDAFYLAFKDDLTFGATIALGNWGSDVAHMDFLSIEGHQFFLLVKNDGTVSLRRMNYTEFPTSTAVGKVPTRLHVADVVRVGKWETDWKQIRVFTIKGTTFILFYRNSGEVFTMPVTWPPVNFTPDGVKLPVFHNTRAAGTWEPDWVQIASFEIADVTFGIDRLDIINQKSDTNHTDIDSLSLVWTITRAATKVTQWYTKTITIPGPLTSGQSVAGPFSTDPFKLSPGDLLTVTAVISNLGFTPADQQAAQALTITKKVVDDLGPIIGAIVGGAIGGPGGVIEGFTKGKDISDAFDTAVQGLSDLASSLGIPVGHPDCNGVVLQNSWTYAANDLATAFGLPVPQQITGPEKEGCGHAPVTNLVCSVRAA